MTKLFAGLTVLVLLSVFQSPLMGFQNPSSLSMNEYPLPSYFEMIGLSPLLLNNQTFTGGLKLTVFGYPPIGDYSGINLTVKSGETSIKMDFFLLLLQSFLGTSNFFDINLSIDIIANSSITFTDYRELLLSVKDTDIVISFFSDYNRRLSRNDTEVISRKDISFVFDVGSGFSSSLQPFWNIVRIGSIDFPFNFREGVYLVSKSYGTRTIFGWSAADLYLPSYFSEDLLKTMLNGINSFDGTLNLTQFFANEESYRDTIPTSVFVLGLVSLIRSLGRNVPIAKILTSIMASANPLANDLGEMVYGFGIPNFYGAKIKSGEELIRAYPYGIFTSNTAEILIKNGSFLMSAFLGQRINLFSQVWIWNDAQFLMAANSRNIRVNGTSSENLFLPIDSTTGLARYSINLTITYPLEKISVAFILDETILKIENFKTTFTRPLLSLGLLFFDKALSLLQNSELISQFLSLSSSGIFVEYISLLDLEERVSRYNAIVVDPYFLITGLPSSITDFLDSNGSLILLPPISSSEIELWFSKVKEQLFPQSDLELLQFSSFESSKEKVQMDGRQIEVILETVGFSKNRTGTDIENTTFFKWISNGYVFSSGEDNSFISNIGLVPPFNTLSHVIDIGVGGSRILMFSSSFMFFPTLTSFVDIPSDQVFKYFLFVFSPRLTYQNVSISQNLFGLRVVISLDGLYLFPGDVKLAFVTNMVPEQIQILIRDGMVEILLTTNHYGSIVWSLGLFIKKIGIVTLDLSYTKTVGFSIIGEIFALSQIGIIILVVGILTLFFCYYLIRVTRLYLNVKSQVVECPACRLKKFDITKLRCSWCDNGGNRNERD